MSFSFRTLCLTLTLLAAHNLTVTAADWTPLFDGKSLDGWVQRGGKAKYSVEDGCIVGTTVPNTANSFLCTERNYSDFVLEVEFKVHPELNSGIQIRSNSLPDYKDGRVHGYQCEIDPADRAWTGGIYDESRRGWLDSHIDNTGARYAFKPGQWNKFRIQCVGDSIRTWLNGVAAADLKDSETASGFIALQVHGVGGRQDPIDVRWRNIRIREITDGKVSDEPAAPAVDNGTGPLVADGAEIRKIAGDFKFTEGPAVGPDGRIYFSDIPNERIHAYDPATDKLELFRENTGRANGLMFAPSGAIFMCEGGARRFTRQFDGELTVVADNWEGKKLNSPNDVTLDNEGGAYFSDPRYGGGDDREIDVEAVYYVPRGGKIQQVINDLVRPNGVILSHDRKTLYVIDNGAGTIFAYDVAGPGKLENKRLFAEGVKGDGATIDARGNLYVAAGEGHVWIWDPKGELLQKIKFPEGPANCTFGGKDGKTLFVTARTGFYSLQMNVAGAR
jgi:sugar lactone lactonase YvrE